MNDNHHHHHHDEEIMTIEEYHKNNIMLFNIKDLITTDRALCTLSSIDRNTFLANGVEHHECKKDELSDHFIEVVKRNLIAHFFDKIEIEKFDALDANNSIDFFFE